MVVMAAIGAAVGIASSIAGFFQTAAANLAKGEAAIEETHYLFKETARNVKELGERNLINNEATARQASQFAGRQIAAGASQGKGVSSSSLMQLADTATKLSRVTDKANRSANWNISNLNRAATRKADQTQNELKANAIATKNAAINSAFSALSQASGVVGAIEAKVPKGLGTAVKDLGALNPAPTSFGEGGTEDSILGSFGPAKQNSLFGAF